MTNAQHIGWMLCWDLAGINISHDDLVYYAKNRGIDSRYIPSKHSFISAYKSAKSNLGARLKKEKLFFSIKPVVDSGDTLCHQLSREVANSRSKEYEAIAQFRFSRSTGRIDIYPHTPVADMGVTQNVLGWLMDEYQKSLNHGTDDFRTLLTNWCDINAVRLRSAGGFYFAPVSCGQDLERLEDLLSVISRTSTIRKVRVLVESQDLTFYQESANNALNSEIAQLEKDLEDFTASVSTPAGKKSGTVRRLQQYQELKQKVVTITSQLGINHQPLIEKLDRLTAAMSGTPYRATSVPAATPAPAPASNSKLEAVIAKLQPTTEQKPLVNAALLNAIAALTRGQ